MGEIVSDFPSDDKPVTHTMSPEDLLSLGADVWVFDNPQHGSDRRAHRRQPNSLPDLPNFIVARGPFCLKSLDSRLDVIDAPVGHGAPVRPAAWTREVEPPQQENPRVGARWSRSPPRSTPR